MARVDKEITDSVTQTNVKVLGDTPAIAMGNLHQATALALSLAEQNAIFAQQQTNIIAEAVTAQGVRLLNSIRFS